MAKFVVAAAHAAPVLLDKEASLTRAVGLIEQAGDRGVQLLVFPEAFVPGFPYWVNAYPPIIQTDANRRYLDQSVDISSGDLSPVSEAAKRAGLNVVLGMSEREEGTMYNAQVLIASSGEVIGHHRKLQPTYAERMVWGQGDGSTLSVWPTTTGRVGGLICWEHTMNLARHALIIKGEQIHAGSWPGLSYSRGFSAVFEDQVEALSRAHAISGQCFVIVASNPVTAELIETMHNWLGPEEYLEQGGGWSAIIHPTGSYIAQPHSGTDDTILVGEIDMDDIKSMKLYVDATGHYSRKDILRFAVDEEKKDGSLRPPGQAPGPARVGDDAMLGAADASALRGFGGSGFGFQTGRKHE